MTWSPSWRTRLLLAAAVGVYVLASAQDVASSAYIVVLGLGLVLVLLAFYGAVRDAAAAGWQVH